MPRRALKGCPKRCPERPDVAGKIVYLEGGWNWVSGDYLIVDYANKNSRNAVYPLIKTISPHGGRVYFDGKYIIDRLKMKEVAV